MTDKLHEMKLAMIYCSCGSPIHYSMDKTFGSRDPEPGTDVITCSNCKAQYGWIVSEESWMALTPHEPFSSRRSPEHPWRFFLWCPECDCLQPHDIQGYSVGECLKCGEPHDLEGNEITMAKGCVNTPVDESKLPERARKPTKLQEVPDEGFQSQQMQVVYQNPNYREIMELALDYHQICELFDCGVCTAKAEDGTAMPANAEELRIININAQEVLRVVMQEAVKRGLNTEEVKAYIKRGSVYLSEHIKAMPED